MILAIKCSELSANNMNDTYKLKVKLIFIFLKRSKISLKYITMYLWHSKSELLITDNSVSQVRF